MVNGVKLKLNSRFVMKSDYPKNYIDTLRYDAAKRAFDQTGIDLMKFNEMMGIPNPVPSEDLELPNE